MTFFGNNTSKCKFKIAVQAIINIFDEAKKQLVRLKEVSENIVGLMESLENEIAELTEDNFTG